MVMVFPPPEEMVSNVHVVVRVPNHILVDILEGSLENFKHAVLSIAEQELSIISPKPVKVMVSVEGVELDDKDSIKPGLKW